MATMNNKTSVEWRGPERKPRVLVSIIDDDVSIREGLAGLMHWMDVDVATFASAAEFLSSPALGLSACIVSDVQMPKMTGFELHGRLLAAGRRIPTILMTAYPSEEARARAHSAGIVCYLSKPFDIDALIRCIRSAVGSAR